jgi:hypothetical protein
MKYTNMFHSKALQLNPIFEFSYENIPFGNPASDKLFRVARFFSVQHSKLGKNIPNDRKTYQKDIHKIYQMDVK